jgi:hypothetical protein
MKRCLLCVMLGDVAMAMEMAMAMARKAFVL